MLVFSLPASFSLQDTPKPAARPQLVEVSERPLHLAMYHWTRADASFFPFFQPAIKPLRAAFSSTSDAQQMRPPNRSHPPYHEDSRGSSRAGRAFFIRAG